MFFKLKRVCWKTKPARVDCSVVIKHNLISGNLRLSVIKNDVKYMFDIIDISGILNFKNIRFNDPKDIKYNVITLFTKYNLEKKVD
jgi:hypothetical protein